MISGHKKRISEIFVFTFILAILTFSAQAATFATTTQSNFNEGTYVRTFYNTSGFVQLNTSQTTGGYTSKIFDAGATANWSSISFVPGSCYGCELLNDNAVENGFANNTNMTRNVLLLHFNNENGENATFFKDWSGLGNNGTCSGTTCPSLSTTAKFNKSYDFDGTNDRINFSNPQTLKNYGNQITLEAWVRPDSFTNTPSIIEKSYQNQFALYFRSSPRVLRVDLVNSSGKSQITGAAIHSTGNWYHIAFTYNGSEMRLYSNGLLDGSPVLASGNINGSTNDLLIGAGWEGNTITYFFNGRIEEVAVYNRSLLQDEIKGHYLRGILSLNMSVRSCDDAVCSGESFVLLNSTPSQNLSVANNKYFQYAVNFTTQNVSYTPEFHSNNINYAVINQNSTVVLNAPSNGSVTTDNHTFLNFTIYDNDLHNMTVWLYGDGALLNTLYNNTNATEITYNWTNLNNGLHNWSVVVNDGFDNSSSAMHQLTVNYLAPNTNSSISINSPANNSILIINSSFLNASVYDIDLNTINVSLYGNDALLQSFVDKTNGSEVTYNWTNLNNGAYNWSVTANDGNSTTTVVSFFTINYTAPNNAPEVQLNSPTNGANITTNSAALNASVYDQNLNNMTVWFYGDGSVLTSTSGNTNGTNVNYNWTSLSDGVHNWSVVVNDGFINASSATYSFLINTTVPNTVPSITLNAPANNSALTVNSTLLNATVYDNELNNMTVWFYGDGSVLNINYNVTNATQTTYNWTNLNNSIHTWYIVSYDGAANTTSITYQFLVNVTEPPAQQSGSTDASNDNFNGNSNDDSTDESSDENNAPQAAKPPAKKPATTAKKASTALFDIAFHVDQKSKEVMSGTEILTTVSLINFGEPGKVVTTVVYVIKNGAGEVVYELSEQVPVETQNEFVKSIAIPRELEEGVYTIGVTLKYGEGQEAYSEDTFTIVKPEAEKKSFAVLWKAISIVGIILTVSLLIYIVVNNRVIPRFVNKIKSRKFLPRKSITEETIKPQKKKLAASDNISSEPYYKHDENNRLNNYKPVVINKETVRQRLERLQEQNFRRTLEHRRKGGFAEPVKHVETYLYPHDKETVRARLERMREKTKGYKPLVKETIKKENFKKEPPKNIGDLGLDD